MATAGYSGTPLQKKLGFKPGMTAAFVDAPDGLVWVCWPKRASKVPTDMTEDAVRDVLLPTGLVDVKVAAVDETWSGLKLVVRRELR